MRGLIVNKEHTPPQKTTRHPPFQWFRFNLIELNALQLPSIALIQL